jgi:hypothetical protein
MKIIYDLWLLIETLMQPHNPCLAVEVMRKYPPRSCVIVSIEAEISSISVTEHPKNITACSNIA